MQKMSPRDFDARLTNPDTPQSAIDLELVLYVCLRGFHIYTPDVNLCHIFKQICFSQVKVIRKICKA